MRKRWGGLGVVLVVIGVLAAQSVWHRIMHLADPTDASSARMSLQLAALQKANDQLTKGFAELHHQVANLQSQLASDSPDAKSNRLARPADNLYNVRMAYQLTEPPQAADLKNKQFYGTFAVQPLTLSERVRYLELKTNARMNWANHYDLDWKKYPEECDHISQLMEFDPYCDDHDCGGLYDQPVCIDDFECQDASVCRGKANSAKQQFSAESQPPCLVYDFGIREQPELGVRMAKDFGCEVHAFDPSPISSSWWTRVQGEFSRDVPNYHFHAYGAGGRDGDISLYEYNWGQVSMMQYPIYINHTTCKDDGVQTHCRIEAPSQKEFKLPVRTLMSVMQELGHKHLSVLKIDAEGAEYAFLEEAFDKFGCLPVDQISLEWHHFSLDPRYGQGSSPEINTLLTLMRRCGFKQITKSSTWTSPDAIYHHMGMHNMRYNIATFKRV